MTGFFVRLSFRRLLPVVLGGVLAGPVAAFADPPPNVSLDAPGLMIKKPKPGPPDVRPQPLAWPRLDPGAVLCRSTEDLARLVANRTGGDGGGPADCRIIKVPTAITILQRQGPGRTEVQVTGAEATGWTDVWLPDKAPVTGAARSAAQR
jgi:hypothetical protein